MERLRASAIAVVLPLPRGPCTQSPGRPEEESAQSFTASSSGRGSTPRRGGTSPRDNKRGGVGWDMSTVMGTWIRAGVPAAGGRHRQPGGGKSDPGEGGTGLPATWRLLRSPQDLSRAVPRGTGSTLAGTWTGPETPVARGRGHDSVARQACGPRPGVQATERFPGACSRSPVGPRPAARPRCHVARPRRLSLIERCARKLAECPVSSAEEPPGRRRGSRIHSRGRSNLPDNQRRAGP